MQLHAKCLHDAPVCCVQSLMIEWGEDCESVLSSTLGLLVSCCISTPTGIDGIAGHALIASH
eukprot:228267-Amphidinium_carterae.1